MSSLRKASIPSVLLAIFLISGIFFFCGDNPTAPEPETMEDPDAPDENPDWIHWIKGNHETLSSITSEDFSDLQFFKPLLEGKRLVQLGESGHGVKQFNRMKVRLIKFLHQEMDFDVIAFESSIYSTYYINERVSDLTPVNMMTNSIFRVWGTHEVLELFEYIKETRQSGDPLILAGFDIQPLVYNDPELNRKNSFWDVISKIDQDYAEEVYTFDANFTEEYRSVLTENAHPSRLKPYKIYYYDLASFIEDNMAELINLNPEHPELPPLLRQTALSLYCYISMQNADPDIKTEVRDKGMAENVEFLLNDMFPDKKIISWAHNFHIAHDTENSSHQQKSMGSWLHSNYAQDMYTVGFYMYRGVSASNTREQLTVVPATSGSIESILYRPRKRYLFVDMLNQNQSYGNSWMFTRITGLVWGTSAIELIPRDQYDGILFIDTVSMPDYYY